MLLDEDLGVKALLSLALPLKAGSVNCHSNYGSPLSSMSSLITHPWLSMEGTKHFRDATKVFLSKAINTKCALEFSRTTAAGTLINTPWIIQIG